MIHPGRRTCLDAVACSRNQHELARHAIQGRSCSDSLQGYLWEAISPGPDLAASNLRVHVRNSLFSAQGFVRLSSYVCIGFSAQYTTNLGLPWVVMITGVVIDKHLSSRVQRAVIDPPPQISSCLSIHPILYSNSSMLLYCVSSFLIALEMFLFFNHSSHLIFVLVSGVQNNGQTITYIVFHSIFLVDIFFSVKNFLCPHLVSSSSKGLFRVCFFCGAFLTHIPLFCLITAFGTYSLENTCYI